MSEPHTDDITSWKAAYLSLLDSWTALCDLAGVEGDSTPGEIIDALRPPEPRVMPRDAQRVLEDVKLKADAGFSGQYRLGYASALRNVLSALRAVPSESDAALLSAARFVVAATNGSHDTMASHDHSTCLPVALELLREAVALARP